MGIQSPHVAYLVCASQRSGSTLLVESLAATGVAGRPGEHFQYLPHSSLSPRPREWFAGVDDASVLALLAPLETGTPDRRTPEQWAGRIRADGRSDNGVWGGKLMWNQTDNVLRRAQGLPRRSGEDLWSTLVDIIGVEPALVHVSRPDVVAQAVSMWRAVQTQVWRGPTDPAVDAQARYHPDGIAHLVRILRAQEEGWRLWFAGLRERTGVQPYDVDYPSLAADPKGVTGKVLAMVGLDPGLAPDPPLSKQGDGRSGEWAERYRRDAERLGLPT